MKIAIPVKDGNLSDHFGTANKFAIFDDQTNQTDYVTSPEHQPGLYPKFLKERDVDCVVTGGIGQRAVSLLHEFDIDIIIAESDSVENIIEKFKKDDLNESENKCDH